MVKFHFQSTNESIIHKHVRAVRERKEEEEKKYLYTSIIRLSRWIKSYANLVCLILYSNVHSVTSVYIQLRLLMNAYIDVSRFEIDESRDTFVVVFFLNSSL
jgi:hypothetical protein